MRRRRRTLLMLLLAGAVALALGRAGDLLPGPSEVSADSGGRPGTESAATDVVLRPGVPATGSPAVSPTGSVTGYPAEGAGSFVGAPGGSPVAGASGPLRRYRVAVESGAGQDPGVFATAVDAVLADGRSWIGSGRVRVQRVAEPAAADFTVYLATPVTSERMCAEGGLSTGQYTSCRLPGQVIVNVARWLAAVPDYGAPLEVYRTYVVNHEVGHEFGEGHEACPGPGMPAPVMQQQTYGLEGCVANPWPFPDGRRYAGDIVP